jgi:hypothetical protein
MPTDLEKLAALRVSKQSDNTGVKPIDLLRAAVYALEKGEEVFTSVVILTREVKPNSNIQTGSWRAGVSREQEMMMLVLAQDELIERLRRPE